MSVAGAARMLPRDLAAAAISIMFTSPDEDTWPGIVRGAAVQWSGDPRVHASGPIVRPEHLLAAQASIRLGL